MTESNLENTKDYLNYDEKTGLFTWKLKRNNKTKAGDIAGYFNHRGYVRLSFNGKHYLAHRLAYYFKYGFLPKYIDHINGVKTDNRIENLRECTQGQNMQNSNKMSHRKYKGPHKAYGCRYISSITHKGVKHHLGTFETEEEAARAYDKKAKELFGEFARLNFPEFN